MWSALPLSRRGKHSSNHRSISCPQVNAYQHISTPYQFSSTPKPLPQISIQFSTFASFSIHSPCSLTSPGLPGPPALPFALLRRPISHLHPRNPTTTLRLHPPNRLRNRLDAQNPPAAFTPGLDDDREPHLTGDAALRAPQNLSAIDIPAADKARRARAARRKATEAELAHPETQALQSAALAYFDAWRDTVLQRVDEALNSSAASPQPPRTRPTSPALASPSRRQSPPPARTRPERRGRAADAIPAALHAADTSCGTQARVAAAAQHGAAASAPQPRAVRRALADPAAPPNKQLAALH